jgi:hypothetical protein
MSGCLHDPAPLLKEKESQNKETKPFIRFFLVICIFLRDSLQGKRLRDVSSTPSEVAQAKTPKIRIPFLLFQFC